MSSKDIYKRFPFFVDIHDWKILVVGGGHIASRRVGVLTDFGPLVTVVSPRVTEAIGRLAEEGLIRVLPEHFRESMIKEETWNLILAATDDEELNHRIVYLAREAKIPVNNASDQLECDFFFPAIVQGQGMILGLVSDGSDHSAVRRTAAKIREEYGEKQHE